MDFGALTAALGAALLLAETLGVEAGAEGREGREMLLLESKRPDPARDPVIAIPTAAKATPRNPCKIDQIV